MIRRAPSPASVLPFPPLPPVRAAARVAVLAVLGGPLDMAVVDLACVLAPDAGTRIDLLLLVEVPRVFPMRAYGERLLAHDADAPLIAAAQHCAGTPGDAGILLCRDAAEALAAEVEQRGCTDLVIAAPSGGRWKRRRAQRAIERIQARAACRVYVVHVPVPPAPILRASVAR